MRRILCALAAVGAAWSTLAHAELVEGQAFSVTSGKDFSVISADGVRHQIKLAGIDVEEHHDNSCQGVDGDRFYCEDYALRLTRGLLNRAANRVRCVVLESKGGYSYAICQVRDQDLGETLLHEGRARYDEFDLRSRGGDDLPPPMGKTSGRYLAAVKEAFAKRIGIWNVVGPVGDAGNQRIGPNMPAPPH